MRTLREVQRVEDGRLESRIEDRGLRIDKDKTTQRFRFSILDPPFSFPLLNPLSSSLLSDHAVAAVAPLAAARAAS